MEQDGWEIEDGQNGWKLPNAAPKARYPKKSDADVIASIDWPWLCGALAVLVTLLGFVAAVVLLVQAGEPSASAFIAAAGYAVSGAAAAIVVGTLGSICHSVRQMSGRSTDATSRP